MYYFFCHSGADDLHVWRSIIAQEQQSHQEKTTTNGREPARGKDGEKKAAALKTMKSLTAVIEYAIRDWLKAQSLRSLKGYVKEISN